jgi:hypothetical protein
MPRQDEPATVPSDAREGRGAGDAHTGDEGKQRIAQDGGDRQPSRDMAQAAVDALVDVGHRAGAADELAHQHEQRNDRKHIVAQRGIGGRAQHAGDDIDVAGHQIEAKRAGDSERDGNMHAERNQHQQADDQDSGDVDVEHGEPFPLARGAL